MASQINVVCTQCHKQFPFGYDCCHPFKVILGMAYGVGFCTLFLVFLFLLYIYIFHNSSYYDNHRTIDWSNGYILMLIGLPHIIAIIFRLQLAHNVPRFRLESFHIFLLGHTAAAHRVKMQDGPRENWASGYKRDNVVNPIKQWWFSVVMLDLLMICLWLFHSSVSKTIINHPKKTIFIGGINHSQRIV